MRFPVLLRRRLVFIEPCVLACFVELENVRHNLLTRYTEALGERVDHQVESSWTIDRASVQKLGRGG